VGVSIVIRSHIESKIKACAGEILLFIRLKKIKIINR